MLIVRIDVLTLRWLWVSFTSEMASHSQYICRVASVLTILNHTHTPNFLPRNSSEQKKARDLYSIVLVAGDYNTMDHPFGAFAHLQEVLDKSDCLFGPGLKKSRSHSSFMIFL
jgi:hypothetical protein